MPTPRFLLLLGLVLLSVSTTAFADGYDDCISACNEPLQPCIDQAKLSAGNVQEEQDMIAACQKSKAGCVEDCRKAEADGPQTQSQPQEQQEKQPQEQQEKQPQEQKQEETLNGTIKIYKFE